MLNDSLFNNLIDNYKILTYADLALFVTLIKRKMEPPNLDCLKFENTEFPLILFLFGKMCINAVILKNKFVSSGIMAW